MTSCLVKKLMSKNANSEGSTPLPTDYPKHGNWGAHRRVEWPTDGQVYTKVAPNGSMLVGPSSALTQDQKKRLKQWGKHSIAQLAYEGDGVPPIEATSLDNMLTCSSVSVDMEVDEPVPSSPSSLNMLDNEWSMDAELDDFEPQIAAPVIQTAALPPVAAPAAIRPPLYRIVLFWPDQTPFSKLSL